MDSSQVGVFKEGDEISLRSLLESHDGRGLETQVSLEVLSNLTDKTLERELPDEELSGLLVTPNFTKSDCSRTEPVWLLDTTSRGRGGLPCSLGCSTRQ